MAAFSMDMRSFMRQREFEEFRKKFDQRIQNQIYKTDFAIDKMNELEPALDKQIKEQIDENATILIKKLKTFAGQMIQKSEQNLMNRGGVSRQGGSDSDIGKAELGHLLEVIKSKANVEDVWKLRDEKASKHDTAQ